MHIRRGTLIALFALPLLLAAGFGWVLWQQSKLDGDELTEVAHDAADRLNQADYPGTMPATVNGVVDAAVESAAQRRSVPVPYQRGADTGTESSGAQTRMIYRYHLTNNEDWHSNDGGDEDVICLTLTQSRDADEPGPGLFEAKQENGKCPEEG